MGLFGALFTGVSGLAAQSQAMGIISNNIANANTTGYKSDSAAFADLVTQADLSDQYNPGGVRAATEQNVTSQGTIEQTTSNTDLAVSGDGMFVVTTDPTGDSSTADPYYTRAGDFTTDSAGNLVNTAGYYLMGWKLDSEGNLPDSAGSISSLTPINVNTSSSILQQTSTIALSANVDSTESGGYYAGANGVPTANPGTPNYTTQLSVVDSLGTTQTLNLNMTQNYPDAWTAQITGAGPNYPSSIGVLFNPDGGIQAEGPVTAGAATVTTGVSSGTASDTFTSSISGNQLTVVQHDDTGTTLTNTTTVYTYGTGVVSTANPAKVTLPDMNFGDGSSTTQSVSLDISSLTQYASESTVNSITSDGIAYGTKTGISIDASGLVSANYSNGQVKAIYQIPLATFNSENSLQESTGDVYQQTTGSGTYYLRQANSGGAGVIVPSALEESNTDIATEFSNMIIDQQAYSANSKVISTADQMLSTLLQIQTS